MKHFTKPKPNWPSLDTAIPFYSGERKTLSLSLRSCKVSCQGGERERGEEGDLSVPQPVERQLRQPLSLGFSSGQGSLCHGLQNFLSYT